MKHAGEEVLSPAISIYATMGRDGVSGDVPERLEGGEGFRVLAGGGQEFAEGGDLGGEIGG